MLEILKIKILGLQPVAAISDQLLDKLIERDFNVSAAIVKAKLSLLNSSSRAGQNRLTADILKLVDKDIGRLDDFIEKANNDYRDIIMWAEYPRCSKLDFDELGKKQMKQIYIDDFREYSNWLRK